MDTMSLFSLSGYKALVTGAGQGLGQAMAIALADAGADVAIADINMQKAIDAAEGIKKTGRNALPVEMDVSKYESIEKAVGIVLDNFKGIDVLVNNAGINRWGASESINRQDWQAVIDVNLSGVFFCSQIVAKQMIKQKKGSIINVASISGSRINIDVTQSAYYSAKAGVIMMTKGLAMEWAPYNIRVNSLSPGWMLTKLIEEEFVKKNKAKFDDVIKIIPLKRFGKPYELGPAVIFLASEASSFVTGTDLVVDGGISIF